MTTIAEMQIPEAAGARSDRFVGTTPFSFFLVDSLAGHPAKAERRVLASLELLHALSPIDHVFIDFDASGKSGSFEREIDVAPYRAFPDRDVTRGVTQAIIDQDLLSGGMAFAIVCDPPAGLEAIDDMYARTIQREALNELDAEVGKIVLASQLARAMIPSGSEAGDRARRLLDLVRLNLTTGDWWESREMLAAIDPVEALGDLRAAMPEFDAVAAAFARYKETATRFYESAAARTQLIVGEAVRSMQGSGGTTGTIVLGLARMDLASSLLRAENVGFVRVTPEGVEPASILDEASVNVGAVSESLRRMGELFSGERVTERTRIEAMAAGEQESRKRRADDLMMAAIDVGGRGEATKADGLFERAIELSPRLETFREAGAHAADHGEFEKAVGRLEAALRLAPRDARSWEIYGVALSGLGQRERARTAFTRGIYLEPRNGRLWSQLGFLLYRSGSREAGCYCFARGKALNDPPSSENFEMMCGPGGARAVAPLALRPFVIFWNRRFVLPVQRWLGRAGPQGTHA